MLMNASIIHVTRMLYVKTHLDHSFVCARRDLQGAGSSAKVNIASLSISFFFSFTRYLVVEDIRARCKGWLKWR